MKKLLLIVLTSAFLFSACKNAKLPADPQNQNQEEWISLFNGKNLEGWDIKIAGRELNDNYLNTFVVEDNMLRIKYNEYEDFGTLYGHLYYEKPYSYYKFKFAYRFLGEQTKGGAVWNVRNSGVMFHSQSAQSLSFNQHFPVSIELQTLGGLEKGKERATANLCTPGTMVEYKGLLDKTHCINSSSKTYYGDQWIEVEAVVLGDSIIHHIIGADTVLTYMKPMVDSTFTGGNSTWEQFGIDNGDAWRARHGELLSSGHIALQAESHPIDFKDIMLLNLEGCMDTKAKNYKSYYLKHKQEACEY